MKPWDRVKKVLIGGGKNVRDPRIFHRLSLIAFFAWVGLGADGLSSVVRREIATAPMRYAGYTAWRGVSSVPVEPGRLTESWGVGERFGLVDIGSGRTYWFATKKTQ